MGGTTNLGRFGTVKRGDIVVLTDKEDAGIQGDKRFQAYAENAKIEGAGLDLPIGFELLKKDEQTVVIRKASAPAVEESKAKTPLTPSSESEEKARLERLNAANESAEVTTLKDMTKVELMEVVEKLRHEKKEVADIKPNSSRAHILKAVLVAKGLSTEGIPTE